MKTHTLLILTFITLLVTNSYAQLVENPEDIAPLLIGEAIPQDIVANMNTGNKNLGKLLKEKPSVVLFYRGGWCPYCNRHLAAVGEAEKAITDLGYQIIGISPDTEEELNKSIKKNKLGYSLFSDAEGRLAQAMGIAFKALEKYENLLQKSSGGKNEGFLPVPSVFVVNKKGTIIFEYISPNYKERITTKLLISTLEALNNQ